jgi:hypothetical protein
VHLSIGGYLSGTRQAAEELIGRYVAVGPPQSEDMRSQAGKTGLDPDRARYGSRMPWLRVRTVSGEPEPLCSSSTGELAAWCGWPARTLTASLVRALPVVTLIRCGASCLSLVGFGICLRVGGKRDVAVEALFPEGGERFELDSSGWSRVLRIDAVGGAPQ